MGRERNIVRRHYQFDLGRGSSGQGAELRTEHPRNYRSVPADLQPGLLLGHGAEAIIR